MRQLDVPERLRTEEGPFLASGEAGNTGYGGRAAEQRNAGARGKRPYDAREQRVRCAA